MHQLPLYLLGQDRTERWTFALDVSDCRAPFVDFVREACGLGAAVSLQVGGTGVERRRVADGAGGLRLGAPVGLQMKGLDQS